MKIWTSYGSEHSMALVIIGHFETPAQAATTIGRMDKLAELSDTVPEPLAGKSLPDAVKNYLSAEGLHYLPWEDVSQFKYCHTWKQQGSDVVVNTDEGLFQGIMHVMLAEGAKIQLYSSHQHR